MVRGGMSDNNRVSTNRDQQHRRAGRRHTDRKCRDPRGKGFPVGVWKAEFLEEQLHQQQTQKKEKDEEEKGTDKGESDQEVTRGMGRAVEWSARRSSAT